MLSRRLHFALEQEVVGQPRAVHTLVRAVTVAIGGLGRPQSPLGLFLFVGPSGTGKSHLATSLSRVLHGNTRRVAVVDCQQLGTEQPSAMLVRQIADHFRYAASGSEDGPLSMAPLSILLVEHLERAQPNIVPSLVSMLERGRLILPDGKTASLSGSLVLMTSNLCSKEIFEAGRQEIGFSSGAEDLEESEKARIYNLCVEATDKHWGADLLGHMDDLVIFHRLHEAHLPLILQRQLVELNRQLATHGVVAELRPSAETFLLSRASRFLQQGAWFLVKVFRRFVTFPVADMLSARALGRGDRIRVGLDDAGDRLRFTVAAGSLEPSSHAGSSGGSGEVAVEWRDEVRTVTPQA